MFAPNKCIVTSCNKISLSTFDSDGNLEEKRYYCLDHIPNPGKAKAEIYNYIKTHDIIVGLNASGLMFSEMEIKNKSFYGCNFSNCTFTNIHTEQVRGRMNIFDFAVFNDCNFLNGNFQFSSFSGATINHSLFTSSEIIQCNFNGIQAFQTSFDDSDLLNSRFIQAKLVDTSFRNCNLKKADFFESERTNVSFKMSNTREARFYKEGSELFLNTPQNDGDAK